MMNDKQFNLTSYIIYLIMCFTAGYALTPIGRHYAGWIGAIVAMVLSWLIATVLYKSTVGPSK